MRVATLLHAFWLLLLSTRTHAYTTQMSRFATRLAYGVSVDLALGCKVCRVPTSKTCNGFAGWLGMGWTLLLLLPGAPILLPRADAVNLVVLFTLPTGCTLLELTYVIYSSFHTQCKLCSFLVSQHSNSRF